MRAPQGKKRIQFWMPTPVYKYLMHLSIQTETPVKEILEAYIEWFAANGEPLGFDERPDEKIVTAAREQQKSFEAFPAVETEKKLRHWLVDHDVTLSEFFSRYVLWLARGNPPVGVPGAAGLKGDLEFKFVPRQPT